MSKYIIEGNGKIRNSDDIELADKLVKMCKNKDQWAVIDELVKIWIKKSPEEAEAVKIDVKDQREILIDKKYGQTKGGKDMERRFQVLFPTQLMNLIRTLYKSDELPFDRKFYKEFVVRYPNFKIAEKI